MLCVPFVSIGDSPREVRLVAEMMEDEDNDDSLDLDEAVIEVSILTTESKAEHGRGSHLFSLWRCGGSPQVLVAQPQGERFERFLEKNV